MKFSATGLCNYLVGYTFGYGTPKIVHVRSFKIGLVNRIVQLSVIGYVIGYAIIYKKGYQEKDVAQSGITTKLKGIGSTVDNISLPVAYRRVWDTPEFAPGQENNAFFVMTNAIFTPNQTLGLCPEDPGLNKCNATVACVKGAALDHGTATGQCVEARQGKYSCQIHGWCPVEKDDLLIPDRPLIPEAEGFTVYIKNNIEFPKFDVMRSNVMNDADLRNCRYNPDDSKNKYCPIFKLGDIIKLMKKTTDFTEIAAKGGVVNIMIQWDCDLDKDLRNCQPNYVFHRLDDPLSSSKGYNYRYAKYYYLPNGTEARNQIKAYGIKFIITVEGKAGRFAFIPLLFNIGAGLGLFGLAKLLTDFVLLNFTTRRQEYREYKYTKVVAEDYNKITRGISNPVKSVRPSSDSATQKNQEQITPT